MAGSKSLCPPTGTRLPQTNATSAKDSDACLEGFHKTRDLDRSVLDLGTFKHPRKLPFIKDILDRLYDETDADYLIYTNVDIALMPFFYLSTRDFFLQGHGFFVINRRTISDESPFPDQISRMRAEIGTAHPGLDCFVFPRTAYKDFFLGEACIGANHIGKIINTNLICNSERYEHFKDLHLTFHLADAVPWNLSKYEDYRNHNRNQLVHVLKHYQAKGIIEDHPELGEYWSRFVEKRSKREA